MDINRNLDLLFVIDDSNSMREEQKSLTDNFPKFIQVLEGIQGGLPNVHIGVVSTSVDTAPYRDTSQGVNARCVPATFDDGRLAESCTRHEGDAGSNPPENAKNPECPHECENLTTDGGENYLVDSLSEDGMSRDTNYGGTGMDLTQNFACRATQGIGGCGLEQPLEAMRRALSTPNLEGDNAGFLREDAFLAVVIISDEDDCSATKLSNLFDSNATHLGPFTKYGYRCFEHGVVCDPDEPRQAGQKSGCVPRQSSPDVEKVQEYVDFLTSLKTDKDKVFVANITGRLEDDSFNVIAHPGNGPNQGPDVFELAPSCQASDSMGNEIVRAYPPVRLNAFANSFRNGSVTEICQADLRPALTEIAEALRRLIGTKCVPKNIVYENDVPQCTVTDVIHPDDEDRTATPIARCSSVEEAVSEAPCWYFELDDNCDGGLGEALVVERGEAEPPVDSQLEFRCAQIVTGSE